MAESKFNLDKFKKPSGQRPPARRPQDITISCRATNPISINDDVSKVFLDEMQAKATTATRLFRNDEIFDAITKVVVPAFLNAKKSRFCMWSSGCSSGEEVYSMAMIALSAFARAKRPAALEVFGTDINRTRLTEAKEGIYGLPGKDALSQAHWRLLQTYADIGQREVSMGRELRQVCKFALFDMRNRPKNHTFFFIVCNHVLQYYDSDGQRHILANLKSVLNPGGYLYLEGLTDLSLQGVNLKKIGGVPNMYQIA